MGIILTEKSPLQRTVTCHKLRSRIPKDTRNRDRRFDLHFEFHGKTSQSKVCSKKNKNQTLSLGLVLKNFLSQVYHVFSGYATSPFIA